ncbi:hypothetical protein GBA52_011784 [Prunus armeniaca]|nr:hypothetical protein GBA52_011784 [Prunus armeniaca]
MLAKVGRLRSSTDTKENTRPKETHERFPFPQALFCLLILFMLCNYQLHPDANPLCYNLHTLPVTNRHVPLGEGPTG